MGCESVQQKLTPFLFRELKVEVIGEIQAHLDSCAACREEAERLKRVVAYLRLDAGISIPDERIAALCESVRGHFGVIASRRLLGASASDQWNRSARGRKFGWAGVSMIAILLAASAALALITDAGGIRSNLAALIEADQKAPPSAGPATREPSTPEAIGDGSASESPPDDMAKTAERELQARSEAILSAAAKKVAEGWSRDRILPDPLLLVDRLDRTFLETWREKIRDRLLAREGEEPERLAASFLILPLLHPSASDTEARRVAATLDDPGAPEPALLAAMSAARAWKLESVGKTLLDIAAGTQRSLRARLAAAESLSDLPLPVDFEVLVGLLAARETPEPLRTALLESLSRHEGDLAIQILGACLDRAPSSEIAIASFRMLGRLSDPRLATRLPRVLSALPGIHEQIRVFASLGETGGEYELLYLTQDVLAYGRYDETVLEAAVSAVAAIASRLGSLDSALESIYRNAALPPSVRAKAGGEVGGAAGNAIAAELEQALHSTSERDRVGAALLLGQFLEAPGREENLSSLLADPSQEVRGAAALGFLAQGPGPGKALLDMATNASEPFENRGVALAAAVLSGFADIPAVPVEPAIRRAAVERLLARAVTEREWRMYEIAGSPPDVYGRHALRYEFTFLVSDMKKRWGLPVEVDEFSSRPRPPVSALTVSLAPPFPSLREFLDSLLEAAGFTISVDVDRIRLIAR